MTEVIEPQARPLRPPHRRVRRIGAAGALALLACVPVLRPDAAHGQVQGAQTAASGPTGRAGNATLYIGTYSRAIYEIDEATEQVTARIPLRTGIPRAMVLSADRDRFYVLDTSYENIEIVDVANRRSVGSFTLSEGNTKVRIWGYNVEPRERYAVLLVKKYHKLPDRYEVSGPILLKYDLQARRVTDTIPWPDDEEREGVRIVFSPDGELLYFFTDEILVLDAHRFNEIERWNYAQALEGGMGRFEFGFPEQSYEEPGFYTGLFRSTDPVQGRRLMGIARVNLAERRVDYSTLGPSESVSFALAPDGRRAYGLQQEVGNYRFWTFDVEGRRIVSRARFQGRPRMSLLASSSGDLLYVYNAGNTIDLYDAATYQYLRTIDMDADTTTNLLVVPAAGAPAITAGAPGEG